MHRGSMIRPAETLEEGGSQVGTWKANGLAEVMGASPSRAFQQSLPADWAAVWAFAES
jgi:hypothetical protein